MKDSLRERLGMGTSSQPTLCLCSKRYYGSEHAEDCPEFPLKLADGVLDDFRDRLKVATAEPNPAWLIECGSPTSYYCDEGDEGDWCSNPNHAWRFATREEAETKAATMTTMEPVRVAEHAWSTPESREDRG